MTLNLMFFVHKFEYFNGEKSFIVFILNCIIMPCP